MLQSNVLQTEEPWSNLLMNSQQSLQGENQTHHGGIHRQHAREEPLVHRSSTKVQE